ncbi:hypothetical protein PPERSA_04820 [Pseudocohnilembus persalinus]|uniref:NRDE family protein n=1 Tax=Pseudocohnilembus persalinus TaxID=266149 RepID=A0A0V0QLT5_PSEPJ|nr:hypothetical protein PPERSA_04820 [Pseudocohnilembus persalinus]|eukprot:KRX03025.1 hypothetical protein PPERSA_04820 [Pseudocohnilembus persalinus]
MCKVFFYINKQEDAQNKIADPTGLKFALLFIRDERFSRNSLPLAQFEEDSNIIGGQDSEEKGTWLGLNKFTQNIGFVTSRYSTVQMARTLLRFPEKKYPMSRGSIIKDYLDSKFFEKIVLGRDNNNQNVEELKHQKQLDYIKEVFTNFTRFGLCNLVFGNLQSMNFYEFSNKELLPPQQLSNGFHSLSSYNKYGGVKLELEELGLQKFQQYVIDYQNQKNRGGKELAVLQKNLLDLAHNNQQTEPKYKNLLFKSEAKIFLEKHKTVLGQEVGTKSINVWLFQNDGSSHLQEKYIGHDMSIKLTDKNFKLI